MKEAIIKNRKKWEKWRDHFHSRLLEIKKWAEHPNYPNRRVGAFGDLIHNSFDINKQAYDKCKAKVKELEYAEQRYQDGED